MIAYAAVVDSTFYRVRHGFAAINNAITVIIDCVIVVRWYHFVGRFRESIKFGILLPEMSWLANLVWSPTNAESSYGD